MGDEIKPKVDQVLTGEQELEIPAPPEAAAPSADAPKKTPADAGDVTPKPGADTAAAKSTLDPAVQTMLDEKDRQIRGLISDIQGERGDKKDLKKQLLAVQTEVKGIKAKLTPAQKTFLEKIEAGDETPFTLGHLKLISEEAAAREASQEPEVTEPTPEEIAELQDKTDKQNKIWDDSFAKVKVLPDAQTHVKAALKHAQEDKAFFKQIQESADPAQALYDYGKGSANREY